MRTRLAALAAFISFAIPTTALASQGILLLAHNGSADWNRQVKEVASKVDARLAADVALGAPIRANISPAVQRLKDRGVSEIVAVPFMMMDKIAPEELTGYSVPLRLATASSSDVIVEIVLSRAEQTRPNTSANALVLIGYGGDDQGISWAADVAVPAQKLNARRHFAGILTIKQPVPSEEAERRQAQAVLGRYASRGIGIVVVPLMSGDEMNSGIKQRLEGLSYETAGSIITDDRLVDWIAAQAQPPAR